ncbi:MAG: sel1 repeat family protein [Opitutales bacterium]|nr:sel1 repeat family protein [Opitutales bacterium]
MKRVFLWAALTAVALLAAVGAGAYWWLETSGSESALRWRAERGQAEAQLELARRHEVRDPGAALGWYEAAARDGLLDGMRGVVRLAEADSAEAKHWTAVLARSGEPEAAYRRAGALEDAGDAAGAEHWLRIAANEGHAAAAWALGARKVAAGTEDGRFRKGVRRIRRAAADGEVEAMYWLAGAYGEAGALGSNTAEAERWMNLAASAGHVEASYAIGRIFHRRARSAHQRAYARERLRFAYDNGIPQAAGPMGDYLWREGRQEEALIHFAVGALAGDFAALERLLRLYPRTEVQAEHAASILAGWQVYGGQAFPAEKPARRRTGGELSAVRDHDGKIVARGIEAVRRSWTEDGADLESAVRAWFAEPTLPHAAYPGWEDVYTSAADGDAEAAYRLALALKTGDGLAKDAEDAAFWLLRAAYGGHVEAAWTVYKVHADAGGPQYDPETAEAMRSLAELAGHHGALLDAAHRLLAKGSADADRSAVVMLQRAEDSAEAEALLEELFVEGRGISLQNTTTRRALVRLAAEDHVWPLYHMGDLHWRRLPRDGETFADLRERAMDYWKQAAALGHDESAVRAAAVLLGYVRSGVERRALEKNRIEAHREGDNERVREISAILSGRDQPPVDHAAARVLLEPAAQRGNAEAHYLLGSSILNEAMEAMQLDEPTLEAGVHHMRTAAEGGNATAEGLFIDLGGDAGADPEETVALSFADLYYQANTLGSDRAAYWLGSWMLGEESAAGMTETALEWIEEAAYLGYEPAFLRLAELYHAGENVEPDALRSLRWLEAAAEAGNADAQFAAGMRYVEGRIVVRDAERARGYLEAAARQGHDAARNALADMARMADSGVVASETEAVAVFAGHGYGAGEIFPIRLVMVEDGGPVAVSSVRRNRPYAVVNNRRVRLDGAAAVYLLPDDAFSPARVEIDELFYTGPVVRIGGALAVSTLSPRIVATLTAEADLRNCFAALVIGDSDGGYRAWWQSIGTLRAGRERVVQVEFEQRGWRNRPVALMIFSDGREVVTSRRVQLSHLGRTELDAFARERDEFLRRAADADKYAPPALATELRPVTFAAAPAGTTFPVRVRVSPDGIVQDLSPPDRLPGASVPELLRNLTRARFLPAVRGGEPVGAETTLEVPVW